MIIQWKWQLDSTDEIWQIKRVYEALQMEVRDTAEEAVMKTIPQKRNATMQNGSRRRPYK